MMTADDVLRVLDLLEGAGIHVWLDGGWGIDALLEEQTRLHNDLDIALNCEDLPGFMQVMEQAGFRPVEGGEPKNFVVADGQGRQVDVHLVDANIARLDDRGTEAYGPNGLAYPIGSLDRYGVVLGRKVRCVTAEFQVESHTWYEPSEKDFQDVLALCNRFELPLPPAFNSRA